MFYHNEKLIIIGYIWEEYTRDVTDKQGGGLGVLFKSDKPITVWPGIETTPERMWILFSNKNEKFAFCHAYIACESHRRPNHHQENINLLSLISKEMDELKAKDYSLTLCGDLNSWVGSTGKHGRDIMRH